MNIDLSEFGPGGIGIVGKRTEPPEFEPASDPLADFAAELDRAQLRIEGLPIDDGEFHRIPDATARSKNNDSGWYVLTEVSPGLWCGHYGSWKRSETHSWTSKGDHELTTVNRAAIENARKEAERKRDAIQKAAALQAQRDFAAATPANDNHSYLVAKGIKAHGARQQGENLIVPLKTSDGEITTYQTISPNGKKRLLKDGAKQGSFFVIGKSVAEKAYVVEGFATGASVHEATDATVIVAFDAGNLLPVCTALRQRYPSTEFVIAADNDQWTKDNPGITKANNVADKFDGFSVRLPEFADLTGQPTDFNDLHVREGLDVVREQLQGGPDGWPDPLDVFATFEPPEFPVQLLPPLLADFVADRTEIMGGDAGILGAAVLVVCAAAIDDGHEVQVKRYETDWTESPRLWIMPVGEPATKKSPILAKAVKPLRKIERQWHDEDVKLVEEYQLKLAVYEVKKREYARKLAKGESAEKPSLPVEVAMRRLLVEDTTPEALGEILAQNERGVLAFADELSGWFGSIGAYKKDASKDKSFWLTAFNGGEGRVDRVGRGSRVVPNLSVGVLGGIQEGPIREIAKKVVDGGLMQRFLIVCARPASEGQDRPEKHGISAEYTSLIIRLAGLVPPETVYRFDADAHKIRENLFGYIHKAMNTLALPTALREHFGKLEGIFARLALTLHIVEAVGHDKLLLATVGEETAKRAAGLLRGFFIPHAFHFYAKVMNGSWRGEHVAWIAGYILARGKERITVRDITRDYRALKGVDTKDIQDVMEILTNYGWVDPVPGKPAEGPKTWNVNPRTHILFSAKAESEKNRREKESQNLKEIFAERGKHADD